MSKAFSNVLSLLAGGFTAAVSAFNGRVGAITLTSGDVTTALAFTPVNQDSPTLIGVPTAPTAASGSNTLQLANTAFTTAAITTAINGLPSSGGVGSFNGRIGTVSLTNSDVVNAIGLTPANIVSPSFLGYPTAPTPAPGTNNTQLATTAFVMGSTTPANPASNYGWTGGHTWTFGSTDPGELGAQSRGFRIAYTTQAGGNHGWVKSGLVIDAKAVAGQTDFEWAQLIRLSNYAAAGENVSLYTQAYKYGTGPTWGACFEAKDFATSGSLYALELDAWAPAGATTNGARFGIGFNFGRTSGSAPAIITYGINFSPNEQNRSVAALTHGLRFEIDCQASVVSVGNGAVVGTVLDLVGAGAVNSLLNIGSSNTVFTQKATAPTAHTGRLKILIDGQVYYIPVTPD